MRLLTLSLPLVALFTLTAQAQQAHLTPEQQETFLLKAKIATTKDVSKGITGTSRVTLKDAALTHDASRQAIDQFQQIFQPQGGKTELNFKDTYKFNVAAWKVGQLIGLESMIPPSVERSGAAYTWWIDDVMMDEGERQKTKAVAPNQTLWQEDNALMKMFDQLISNTDRNVGNIVIDKNWRVWMIDHTRAFRPNKTLTAPDAITQIDRSVLAKLKTLDKTTLGKATKGLLNGDEMSSLLLRRDEIVKILEAKGDAALFTLTPRP